MAANDQRHGLQAQLVAYARGFSNARFEHVRGEISFDPVFQAVLVQYAGRRQWQRMPMELLGRLCKATMPCHVSDDDDIQKLSVLRAAQLIEADIPPLSEKGGYPWFSGPAFVHRVTKDGFSAARCSRFCGHPDHR